MPWHVSCGCSITTCRLQTALGFRRVQWSVAVANMANWQGLPAGQDCPATRDDLPNVWVASNNCVRVVQDWRCELLLWRLCCVCGFQSCQLSWLRWSTCD